MHLTQEDILNTPKIKRLNIINSITGIKPANLIGTTSEESGENLAIFSSVVHLGSNPALLGFILRPQGDVPRNTYENIRANPYYTINHVHQNRLSQSHYTSAKFDREVSEFKACQFTSEYLANFPAPFVKESTIKMGMHFLEEIPIPINGTSMIIGEVKHLFFPDEIMTEEGYLDLEKAHSTGIGGLNGYYKLEKKAQFPFARPEELPEF